MAVDLSVLGFGDVAIVRHQDGRESVALKIRKGEDGFPIVAICITTAEQGRFTLDGYPLRRNSNSRRIVELIRKLDWRPEPKGESTVSGTVDLFDLKFGDSVKVRRRDGVEGTAIRFNHHSYPVVASFCNGDCGSHTLYGAVNSDGEKRGNDIVAIIAEPPVPAEPWKGAFVRIGDCEVIELFGQLVIVTPDGLARVPGVNFCDRSILDGVNHGVASQPERCQLVLRSAAKEQARIDAESAASAEQTARAEAEKLFQWVDLSTTVEPQFCCVVDDVRYTVHRRKDGSWRGFSEWGTLPRLEAPGNQAPQDAKSACVDHYLRRAK